MITTWYAIIDWRSGAPSGLFVTLAGNNPRGLAILRFNHAQRQFVSGYASCSRYLSWGEPGADVVTEQQAADILEGLGWNMAAAKAQLSTIALTLQSATT